MSCVHVMWLMLGGERVHPVRVVCPSGTIADLCVSVRAAPARAVVRPPCHLLLTKSPRMVSHESICPQWALRSASRPAPAPHAASTPSASCCAPSFEAARPCRRAALLEPGHNGGACGSSGRNRRFGIVETRGRAERGFMGDVSRWLHLRKSSANELPQRMCLGSMTRAPGFAVVVRVCCISMVYVMRTCILTYTGSIRPESA